jgi:hypothetical protein
LWRGRGLEGKVNLLAIGNERRQIQCIQVSFSQRSAGGLDGVLHPAARGDFNQTRPLHSATHIDQPGSRARGRLKCDCRTARRERYQDNRGRSKHRQQASQQAAQESFHCFLPHQRQAVK